MSSFVDDADMLSVQKMQRQFTRHSNPMVINSKRNKRVNNLFWQENEC